MDLRQAHNLQTRIVTGDRNQKIRPKDTYARRGDTSRIKRLIQMAGNCTGKVRLQPMMLRRRGSLPRIIGVDLRRYHDQSSDYALCRARGGSKVTNGFFMERFCPKINTKPPAIYVGSSFNGRISRLHREDESSILSPSTKFQEKQMIGMARTKLDPSPQQPPLSKKDRNPTSFKRVTMGIRKGAGAQATGQHKNNGKSVY